MGHIRKFDSRRLLLDAQMRDSGASANSATLAGRFSILDLRPAIARTGSAGCQPVAFGSLPNVTENALCAPLALKPQ